MTIDARFITDATLDDWTGYHPPSSQIIIDAHTQIRAAYNHLLKEMNALLPEGPDKTVALRAIRTAMYDANACIALEQKVYDHSPSAEAEAFKITNEPQDAVKRCEQCNARLVQQYVNRELQYYHWHQSIDMDHKPVI